ncbi:hypothetical protein [Bradyrhizobium septentrionale]|uniref:Hedgehog/Intein (Hint) domain-containing protein n=1 Tax=Bradyrhizobium septentrionale TaxID=1404411 RepID=A0ABZ2NUM1_9BRAD
MTRLKEAEGRVERVVDSSIAYVTAEDQTLTFGPGVVANYRGETFEELGIVPGRSVRLTWLPASGLVGRVALEGISGPRPPQRSIVEGTFGPDDDNSSANRRGHDRARASQLELHPDGDAVGSIAPFRSIPTATRSFGKLVDTSNLQAGDLILTRDIHPDGISTLITDVQREGGYHPDDARWTHAAMYLGDGGNVIEATFENPVRGGDVRLSSLDSFCEGAHALRFRRSRFIAVERDGWRVCVRAMSRLGKPYNIFEAASMWFRVIFRAKSFSDFGKRDPTSAAIICSVLYADAYNEATRRSLGEVNGACVPAWLSGSDEFDDVKADWLTIR